MSLANSSIARFVRSWKSMRLVHGSAMFFRAIDLREIENIPENKCQNTSLLPPRKLHVGSR